METTQSGAISMRKKTAYIITGCVMGVLIIVSVCCILHFEFLHRENIYLKQVIAILGMLFAAILFVCRLIHPTPLSAASKPLAVEKGGKA